MEWDDSYLNDFVTLSVYADYVEDRGDDTLTKGLRYCVANKIRPHISGHYEDQCCWTNDRYRDRMKDAKDDSTKRYWMAAVIPNEFFDKMPHNFTNDLMIAEVRAFQTAGEAYSALGRALP